jgi:hypothetical protein
VALLDVVNNCNAAQFKQLLNMQTAMEFLAYQVLIVTLVFATNWEELSYAVSNNVKILQLLIKINNRNSIALDQIVQIILIVILDFVILKCSVAQPHYAKIIQ